MRDTEGGRLEVNGGARQGARCGLGGGEAIDQDIGKSLFIRAEGGGDRQSSGEGRQNKVVLGGSCGLCPGVARGAREQPSSEPAFAQVRAPIPSHLLP